jgi:hypothetical protein
MRNTTTSPPPASASASWVIKLCGRSRDELVKRVRGISCANARETWESRLRARLLPVPVMYTRATIPFSNLQSIKYVLTRAKSARNDNDITFICVRAHPRLHGYRCVYHSRNTCISIVLRIGITRRGNHVLHPRLPSFYACCALRNRSLRNEYSSADL